MTDEQLTAIRARCEAATPGPWRREGGSPACVITQCPPHKIDGQRVFCHLDGSKAGQFLGICFGTPACSYWEQEWADLDFIAAAREDVTTLLTEIGRLRELLFLSGGGVCCE